MLSIDLTSGWIWPALMAVVLVVATWLIVKIKKTIRRSRGINLNHAEIREEWGKITRTMNLRWQKEMNSKLAVMAADKLLDQVLVTIGFSGVDASERLKVASYRYPKLRHVQWAHEVRKQIEHNPNYSLKYGESWLVLKLFKRALRELGAL